MAVGSSHRDAVLPPAKGRTPQVGPMFSLRIVNLEHYMAPPLPGMDVCYSKFQGRTVVEVPVVRVYGSTPAGQKACLHLHQVFPYFYVPYDDDLPQDITEALAYVRSLASAIEKAMKLANSAAAKKQHVHSCSLVRARRYYGYYPSEQLFIKIVLYHPQEVARISALLQGGAIMNRKFQPHEAHIPYLLQLLIDQNLAGMSHLHLSSLKFRQPIPERPSDTAHIIKQLKAEFMQTLQQAPGGASTSQTRTMHDHKAPTMETTPPSSNERSASGSPFGRHSTCELEADASVEDILNRHELLFMPLQQAGPAIKLVQSLMPMWEEERLRTGEVGPAGATAALRPSAERFPPTPSALEQALRDSLFQIVHDEERFSQHEPKTDPFLMSTQEMLRECSQAANVVKRHVEGQDEMEPRLDTRSIGVQDGPEDDNERDEGAGNTFFSQQGLRGGELLDEHIVRSQLIQQGRISQDVEREVAELLGWMGASQEEHEMEEAGSEEDDEEAFANRGAFSQVWGTASMEAAMLQALSEFENASQKECREILDCVNDERGEEDEGEEDDLLEAALEEINIEDAGAATSSQDRKRAGGLPSRIPQVDGAGDNHDECDDMLHVDVLDGSVANVIGNTIAVEQNGKEGDQEVLYRIPQIDGAGDYEDDTDFSPEPKRMRVSSKESKKEESHHSRQEREIPKRSGWGALPVMGSVSSQLSNEGHRGIKTEGRSAKQAAPEVAPNRSLGYLRRHKELGSLGGAPAEEKRRGSEVSLRALMRKQRERQFRLKESSASGGDSLTESQSEGEQSSYGAGVTTRSNFSTYKDPISSEDSKPREDHPVKQNAPPSAAQKASKYHDREKLSQKVSQNQGIATPLLRDPRPMPKFGILPIVNRGAEPAATSSPPKQQQERRAESRSGAKRQLIETGLGQPVEDVVDEVDKFEPVTVRHSATSKLRLKNQEVSVEWGCNLLESGDHRDCGGGSRRTPHVAVPAAGTPSMVKTEAFESSQVNQGNQFTALEGEFSHEAVQLTLTKEYEDLFLASALGLTGKDVVIPHGRGLIAAPAVGAQRRSSGSSSMKPSTRKGLSPSMVVKIVEDEIEDSSARESTSKVRFLGAEIKPPQQVGDVTTKGESRLGPVGEADLESNMTPLRLHSSLGLISEEACNLEGDDSLEDEIVRKVADPPHVERKEIPNTTMEPQIRTQKEEPTGERPHKVNKFAEERVDLIVDIAHDISTANVDKDVCLVDSVPDVKEDQSEGEVEVGGSPSTPVEIDKSEAYQKGEGNEFAGLVFTDMLDGSEDSFDGGDDVRSSHRLAESDEGAELSEEELPWSPLPDVVPPEVPELTETGVQNEIRNLQPQLEKIAEIAPINADDGVSQGCRVSKKTSAAFSTADANTAIRVVAEEPEVLAHPEMQDPVRKSERPAAMSGGDSVSVLGKEHAAEGASKKPRDTLEQFHRLLPATVDLNSLSRFSASSKTPEDRDPPMRPIDHRPESTFTEVTLTSLRKASGAMDTSKLKKLHGKEHALQSRREDAQERKSENLVALKFHQKPPSREVLMDSLGQHGLRGVDYTGVFYGNPEDVPARPTISAGLIFDVKSKEAPDLPPFLFGAENKKSAFTTRRSEQRHKPSSTDPPVMGVPCHYENDGSVSYLLSPARPPPSRLAVQKWLSETHAGGDVQNRSGTRGEHVFRMDANTGKLVPVGDMGSNGPSQESLTMHDSGESGEGMEYLRPASPKYDEKHVLATPSFTHPPSPAYALSGKKSKVAPAAATSAAGVLSTSRSPHLDPSPVTPKEVSPANTQSSGEVISKQPTSPKTLLPQADSQEEKKNVTAVQDLTLLPLSLQFVPPPSPPTECTPLQPAEDEIKTEASKAQQPTEGNPIKSSKSPLRWRDVSQITAPSPEKGQLTPLSQSGFRDPASIGAGQQVTLMSIEVHSETRGNLRPDPRYDAIGMVVIVIQYDDEAHGECNNQTVVLIVDAKAASSTRNIDGVTGCSVIYLHEELTLLNCFVRLVRLCDPDILVGWEIQGYSLGLLAERAANLGFGLLKQLSRTPPKPQPQPRDLDPDRSIDVNDDNTADDGRPKVQELRNSVFGDKIPLETVGVTDSVIADEWGRTHGSGLFVGGRIILNLWRIMRGEVKLGIYTLEAVAEAVLRRRVPRIPWRTLTKWFARGPAQGRFRCIEYFVDRAQLNFQIMDQLDLLNRTAELARVFGIDFFSVFSRGSQYRVESMMLRLAHTQNFLLLSPSRQQVAAQPAMECLPLVMEPESRFYTSPVVVLDFQSLYPSMIIAYNLCFSTCLGKIVSNNPKVLGVTNLALPPGLLKELKDRLTITPNGVMYTPPEVCQGVVPRLLSEILSTRIMVKQAMKKLSPDQRVLQRVLNARQFALKLIANVTYGYTAAGFSGRMPCAELADSIVQCGRLTLERAIHLVNSEKRWDARVVYGDTDSMFVLLEGRTREEAFRIGQEIAAAVTAVNPNPVTLKMEKVYHPCVLLTKKRYVGYSYESPGQLKPTFDAKGIETVRRDSCAAVAKTLERSLRTLFETQDLSQVKQYLQRQWGKILSGRVSLRDFIFAKEVRLGTYSTRASVLPAAAIVASKAMSLDPRAEPRYAERVPYVVVHGEPGARLSDVVVDPHTMLANGLRLHDTYYITKQIIPALQRVFGLVGADLRQWYAELPRVYRPPMSKRFGKITAVPPPPIRAGSFSERAGGKGGGTIDHYYLSQHCSVCGELMRGSQLVCTSCSANPQAAVSVLTMQTAQLEKEFKHLEAICRHCGGADGGPEGRVACISLDCPIFFERLKTQKEVLASSTVSFKCGYYPTCLLDFGSELF